MSMFDRIEAYYDKNKRKEMIDVTVADLVALLSKYPTNAIVRFCGSNMGYIHVAKDNLTINVDVSPLSDDYAYYAMPEHYVADDGRLHAYCRTKKMWSGCVRYECTSCGTYVQNADVTECPECRAVFDKRETGVDV